jgi:hypothetical protein
MRISGKTYLGVQTPHGVQTRIREGHSEEILDLRLDLTKGETSDWNNEDRGPQQLALAVLYDAMGDETYALARFKEFAEDIVKQFEPGAPWRLPLREVLIWAQGHPLAPENR